MSHARLAVQDMQIFVILLRIVVDPQLPVRAYLGAMVMEHFEFRAFEMRAHMVRHRPEKPCERFDVVVERDKDKTAENLDANRPQTDIVLAKSCRLVARRPRDAGTVARKVEAPEVIEALDAVPPSASDSG